jgi:hypothetical protein
MKAMKAEQEQMREQISALVAAQAPKTGGPAPKATK